MVIDRQKVCPKCRAFVHRKMAKCPYCSRPLDSKAQKKGQERCRLCGSMDYRVLPLTDDQPGTGARATRKVCANCGKDV